MRKSNSMINRQRKKEKKKNKNQSQVYLLAIINRLAEENNQSDFRGSQSNAANVMKIKKIEREEERAKESQKGKAKNLRRARHCVSARNDEKSKSICY